MDEDFLAWPFSVLKPDATWDEFDRDCLDFMRMAYAEGYRPRYGRSGSPIVADNPNGRSAFLVSRGPCNGWEPWLEDHHHTFRLGPYYALPQGDSACVCVRPPFRGAAYLALEWLRGHSLDSLLDDFEFVGGLPAGIVL